MRWTAAARLAAGGLAAWLVAAGPDVPAQAAPPGPLAMQAVVTVLREERPVGSGFAVSPEGYILTAAHVVSEPGRLSVRFANGLEAGVQAVARDDRADVALLRAPVRSLPVLTLGDSRNLKAGDRVWIAGAPVGLEQSVSSGYVAASRRLVGERAYIQLDISLNPGNSGGPVLDDEGRVVGIAAARVANAQGIGLAIPVAALEDLLARWQVAVAVDLSYEDLALQPASEQPARGGSDEMQAVRWATAAVSVAVLAIGAGLLVGNRRRRRWHHRERWPAGTAPQPGPASLERRRGLARLGLGSRRGRAADGRQLGTGSQGSLEEIEVILHDR